MRCELRAAGCRDVLIWVSMSSNSSSTAASCSKVTWEISSPCSDILTDMNVGKNVKY